MKYTLSVIMLFAAVVFSGCKKEKVIRTTNVSNAEAANMVAMALAVNSNGFISIKNDMVQYARTLQGTGKGCGVIDSFAIARQDAKNAPISFNYALGYYYTVNCNGNTADNLTSNIVYTGSFDSSILSVINSVNSTANIGSLTTGASYIINGDYHASGSFQTYDATQLSGNNNITISINNLMIVKSSRAISSGSANVILSGTIKNKNTFNYTGTITFNNATTAALKLAEVNYTINLTTGDISIP